MGDKEHKPRTAVRDFFVAVLVVTMLFHISLFYFFTKKVRLYCPDFRQVITFFIGD